MKSTTIAVRMVVALLATTFVTTGIAVASGTYRPPKPPAGMKFDRSVVAAGEKLFKGPELVGESGRSCITCHDKGLPERFSRSSLKRKGNKLFEKVQKCVSDPARTAGKPLVPATKHAYQLGAYLISKYRLPFAQLPPFATVPAPPEKS